MKLTWADIEAHRSAATPQQWRRLEAHLRDHKTIAQVAAEEGRPTKGGRGTRTSISLSIGRGSTAILCSMLGRQTPTERHLAEADEARTRRAETATLLAGTEEETDACDAGCHSGNGVVSPATKDEAVQCTAAPAPCPSETVSHEGDIDVPDTHGIVLGMRVEGPSDAGRVESIEGETALVAWDSGVRTPAPLADLTPLQVGGR